MTPRIETVSSLILALSVFSLTTKLCRLELLNETRFDDDDEFERLDSISKRTEVDGWSEWNMWSVCSRSCDGGVTFQLRKCLKKSLCQGASMRYKICNMQPCPDMNDFRATQCSAYNNVPYRGRLYEWLPFYDPEDPCSLTCQAKTFNFVAKMAPKVQDGTRCRDGALDMCVGGKCMTVGCDLQLESVKRIDDCGVCGGDGSACRRPVYTWGETQFSPCSVTCGGGYQTSRPICRDKETEKEMDERLCDVTLRPRADIRECSTHKCPASWVTENWGPCTTTCGGGRQLRLVYCTQGGQNGTHMRVSDHQCPHQKPPKERPCSTQECPMWFEGPWSGCSLTCGKGFQTRTVVCRDTRGMKSDECDPSIMPPIRQSCSSGIQCTDQQSLDMARGSQEDAPPNFFPPASGWPQKLISPAAISAQPNFVASEWGACSVSCGEGIRKRTVHCKILLQFSKTIAKLPDKECPGPKPNDLERCVPRLCSLGHNKDMNGILHLNKEQSVSAYVSSNEWNNEHNSIPVANVGIEVTYSWKASGFTTCSASCLGGTRESIIRCVRDHDQASVSPYLCDISAKPDALTQTCNDIPCPPRWNISDFSSCSKPCGGGNQTRTVQCIHEVTRGTLNTLIVPMSLCPHPQPRAQQFCNVFDCPTSWHSEPWSKCSKNCGGGFKTRKLKCQKELAFGQIIEQPPSRCPKRKPKTVKPCNKKDCKQKPSKPHIYISQQNYVQQNPRDMVSLKVGGRAIVFKGTIVKVRCPRKKSNKTEILWFKDRKPIDLGGKYRTTRKGTLRIRKITYGDGGIYTCMVGKAKGDINISVKPAPPGYSTSDEDRTVERPLNKDNKIQLKQNKDGDFSHEQYRTNNKDGGQLEWTMPTGSKTKHPNKLASIDFSSSEKYGSRHHKERVKPKTKSASEFHRHAVQTTTTKSPTTTDTWGYQQGGGTLFSDQDSGELNAGTPHDGQGTQDMGDAARSSAASSHSMPPIQQFLANLHNSLGSHQTMTHHRDEDQDDQEFEEVEEDDPPPRRSHHHSVTGANSFVLGRGRAENLEFEWETAEWSPCSQTCGGNGLQVRNSQCMVRLNNVTKTVDSSLCEDAGSTPPITLQKCGFDACPGWQTGPWSDCLTGNCFSWERAYQERELFCQFSNGTKIQNRHCDKSTQPQMKQECFNENCKGTWTVGEWSDCTVSCGGSGFSSRILQCVWFGTKKPAGHACQEQPRPAVVKACQAPPCPQGDQCQDRYNYCNSAKDLNMCKMSFYRRQCCLSCRET